MWAMAALMSSAGRITGHHLGRGHIKAGVGTGEVTCGSQPRAIVRPWLVVGQCYMMGLRLSARSQRCRKREASA